MMMAKESQNLNLKLAVITIHMNIYSIIRQEVEHFSANFSFPLHVSMSRADLLPNQPSIMCSKYTID